MQDALIDIFNFTLFLLVIFWLKSLLSQNADESEAVKKTNENNAGYEDWKKEVSDE